MTTPPRNGDRAGRSARRNRSGLTHWCDPASNHREGGGEVLLCELEGGRG